MPVLDETDARYDAGRVSGLGENRALDVDSNAAEEGAGGLELALCRMQSIEFGGLLAGVVWVPLPPGELAICECDLDPLVVLAVVDEDATAPAIVLRRELCCEADSRYNSLAFAVNLEEA